MSSRNPRHHRKSRYRRFKVAGLNLQRLSPLRITMKIRQPPMRQTSVLGLERMPACKAVTLCGQILTTRYRESRTALLFGSRFLLMKRRVTQSMTFRGM